MKTTTLAETDPRDQASPAKTVWTRPTLDVADIETLTQAGGAISADSDPNQPS